MLYECLFSLSVGAGEGVCLLDCESYELVDQRKIKCQFILVTLLPSRAVKKRKKKKKEIQNYRGHINKAKHTSCVFVLFHKFLLIFFPFYFSNVNVHSQHHTKFNLTR